MIQRRNFLGLGAFLAASPLAKCFTPTEAEAAVTHDLEVPLFEPSTRFWTSQREVQFLVDRMQSFVGIVVGGYARGELTVITLVDNHPIGTKIYRRMGGDDNWMKQTYPFCVNSNVYLSRGVHTIGFKLVTDNDEAQASIHVFEPRR